MPGGDRTGPLGQGPRTGRGAGYCNGYAAPGYANAGAGYGRGMGRGRGGGYRAGGGGGGGRSFRWFALTPQPASAPVQPTAFARPNNEVDALRQRADAMQQEMDALRRQLAEFTGQPVRAAVVNAEQCAGCGACVQVCPSGAIAMRDGLAVVDAVRCTGCGQCVEACPQNAVALA